MVKSFTILPLYIETTADGFYGCLTINDDDYEITATSVIDLKSKMKDMIYAGEGIHVDDFTICQERPVKQTAAGE